jgi:hypothetical protein
VVVPVKGVEYQEARPRAVAPKATRRLMTVAERLPRGGLCGEAASIPGSGVLSPYVSVVNGLVAGAGGRRGMESTKWRNKTLARHNFGPLSRFAL